MDTSRVGSFADGQAQTEPGAAPAGRFSRGQERTPGAVLHIGTFATGQATMRPQPIVYGRFSTGQERGDRRERPARATQARASGLRDVETAERH